MCKYSPNGTDVSAGILLGDREGLYWQRSCWHHGVVPKWGNGRLASTNCCWFSCLLIYQNARTSLYCRSGRLESRKCCALEDQFPLKAIDILWLRSMVKRVGLTFSKYIGLQLRSVAGWQVVGNVSINASRILPERTWTSISWKAVAPWNLNFRKQNWDSSGNQDVTHSDWSSRKTGHTE